MNDSRDTVCFTCGQPAGEVPRLNCLPGGQVCPTCRDRLLECLPPCLPGEASALEEFYAEDAKEEPSAGASAPIAERSVLEASKGPGQLIRGEGLGDEPA